MVTAEESAVWGMGKRKCGIMPQTESLGWRRGPRIDNSVEDKEDTPNFIDIRLSPAVICRPLVDCDYHWRTTFRDGNSFPMVAERVWFVDVGCACYHNGAAKKGVRGYRSRC
jgi:hypothetical protein